MSSARGGVRVEEVIGDLFWIAPTSYALGHCVGADFWMSRGIAVDFRKRYGSVDYLKGLQVQVGKVAMLPPHISGNSTSIFYLVTKEKSYEKPSWENFRSAVEDLAKLCVLHNISGVAMPRIGTGCDELKWPKVLQLLRETFDSMKKTKVLICHLPGTVISRPLEGVRIPSYQEWQLIGDSQLLRFASKFCANPGPRKFPKQVGLCISGQTTLGLLRHIDINNIRGNVVCMIGTNDARAMAEMTHHQRDYKQNLRLYFHQLRTSLLKGCNKVIFVTIPPIPHYGDIASSYVQFVNHLVKGCTGEKCFVLDIYRKFHLDSGEIDLTLFEETMGPPWNTRTDLIHLNGNGMSLLKTALDSTIANLNQG